MSKDCGLSEAATAVNSQVESAKGEVDGLIANADKGIADAIAGLKNKVSGLTDGIKNKIEAMAPEIPEPDAKLQDEVTSMLESADSPGDMVQKYATMKEKFGGAVDIAFVLDAVGIDSKKLESLDKQLGDAITSGKSKAEELFQKVSSGFPGGETLSSKASNLIKIASGDVSAIGDLVGGFSISKPGFDTNAIKDKVCTQVPNLEVDADGNTVKKGVETKASTEEAVKIEEPAKKKEPENIKPETKQTNEALQETKEGDVEFAYTAAYLEAMKPFERKKEKRTKELNKYYKKEYTPLLKELRKLKKDGVSPMPRDKVIKIKSVAKYVEYAQVFYIVEKYTDAHIAGVAIPPDMKKEMVDTPRGMTLSSLEDLVQDAEVRSLILDLPYFTIFEEEA